MVLETYFQNISTLITSDTIWTACTTLHSSCLALIWTSKDLVSRLGAFIYPEWGLFLESARAYSPLSSAPMTENDEKLANGEFAAASAPPKPTVSGVVLGKDGKP